jgi:hypothetical protein
MRRLSQNKGDQEYAASQHVALLAPIVAVYPKPEEHGSQGHNSQQEKADHLNYAPFLIYPLLLRKRSAQFYQQPL